MPPCRTKANVLTVLQSITAQEHQSLREKGGVDSTFWSKSQQPDKELVGKFRREVKDHYLIEQTRRCCYCCFELQSDHSTFDAEHIVDQKTHPNFMFELGNLAAACKRCNKCKSTKPSLVDGLIPVALPTNSADYKIVHPHLDEWDEHLKFDQFDRIKAIDPKGKATMDLCGIDILNAVRLSDHFQRDQRKNAEKALRSFYKSSNQRRRQKHLQLLRNIADNFGLAQAKVLVDGLEEELTNPAR